MAELTPLELAQMKFKLEQKASEAQFEVDCIPFKQLRALERIAAALETIAHQLDKRYRV